MKKGGFTSLFSWPKLTLFHIRPLNTGKIPLFGVFRHAIFGGYLQPT